MEKSEPSTALLLPSSLPTLPWSIKSKKLITQHHLAVLRPNKQNRLAVVCRFSEHVLHKVACVVARQRCSKTYTLLDRITEHTFYRVTRPSVSLQCVTRTDRYSDRMKGEAKSEAVTIHESLVSVAGDTVVEGYHQLASLPAGKQSHCLDDPAVDGPHVLLACANC